MGKPNIITKQYMEDNTRFADACNFFLFQGKPVIKPEDLAENEKQWSVLGAEEIDLLNICLDAKLKIARDSEKGAENLMCKGIIELQEMSRAKGKIEGKIEGETRMGKLVSLLYAEHRLDEIPLAVSNAEIRTRLYEEHGIA